MKTQILKTVLLVALIFVASVAFAQSQEEEIEAQDEESLVSPRAPLTSDTSSGDTQNRTTDVQRSTETTSEVSDRAVALEQITVTGRFDFCDPIQMRNRLRKNYEPSFGGLLKPGQNICGRPECVQDFYFNGNKGHIVTDLDEAAKKLTIRSGYASCNTGNDCQSEQAQSPSIEILTGAEFTRLPQYRNYILKLDLKFDEIYNADFKAVTVVCPEGSCFGATLVNGNNHMIYTEKRQASGQIVKRLVVNGTYGSKLKKSGTEDSFSLCEYTP